MQKEIDLTYVGIQLDATIYAKIEIPSDKDLRKATCQLDKHQREVINMEQQPPILKVKPYMLPSASPSIISTIHLVISQEIRKERP